MARKVMLLAMALDLGGAETHVVTLAEGLLRHGWTPVVVSAGGRLVARLEAAGIRHLRAPLASRSPLDVLRALGRVRRALREEAPDVLHAHARIPAWVSETARRGLGLPLVTTYHGVYQAGWFWRRVSRWGDVTIAVSAEVKEHLVERLGAPEERVRVIPNGVDTEHFAPAAAPPPVEGAAPDDGPVIVHVSRLDEVLEPALALCDAAAALAPRWPRLRALIVGGGRGEAAVAARAREANARAGREVVRLVGARPDPLPYLQRADAVVAAGRAALEAMACGRPLIVAGAGGLAGWAAPETWEALARTNLSGRGGGVPATGEALAALLAAGLERPEELRRLGSFGRDVVVARYSIESMVRAVVAAYEDALRLRRTDRTATEVTA
ncbi:MAG: glycosyltransferase [Firmicutes bacterium]|nr:glycosyltransferase [Bacillota bacterium]